MGNLLGSHRLWWAPLVYLGSEIAMMSHDTQTTKKRDRFDALAILALSLVIALPVRGLMRYQGATMEEGFMLAFPEMVLHGLIPNKDFLHLYGPGGLWVLAGSFKAFGVSLATERIIGLAQHVGIVFGLFALTRRFGRGVAVVVATTALVINISPTGLTALAWNGALAFALWGLWCVLRARSLATSPRANWWLTGGGLLASMALLYRPDLIVALTLGFGALLWKLPRTKWFRFGAGLLLAAVGYVVHFAMAGPGNAIGGMFIDPVFRLRDGRSLPMPPPWDHLAGYFQKAAALRTLGWPFPQPGLSHQLFIWFVVTLLAAVWVAVYGVRCVRRAPDDLHARTLAGVGLFGLGLCTQALQRVDQVHLAWVSCITISMVPAAIAHWRANRENPPIPWLRPTAAAAAFSVVLLGAVIPQFTIRGYVDVTSQTFGRNIFGFPVQRNDRNFYVANPDVAHALQGLVDDFDRLHPQPGERLFVGPEDMRFTPYNDAFLYYLFPDLTPATYFVEMDPFDAKPGSRLADDVASADWLILSNVWRGWKEPNASSRPGSDAPNAVVRDKFCRLGAWGDIDGRPMYVLYQRCDRSGT